MEVFKPNLLIVLIVISLLQDFIHGQDQTGFISLDCGLPEGTSYSETTTTINYISDASFIDTGVSKTVLPQYQANRQRQVHTVRSFPEGIRNCYKVTVKNETRYLIRAMFLYGNYDGLDNKPEFDIHIGANFWDTVEFNPSGDLKEIIHTPLTGYLRVCLVNTGAGTPFISALELRPLKSTIYQIASGGLSLITRVDLGSVTNLTYRYPTDPYDRVWVPYHDSQWDDLTTNGTVDARSHMDYLPPSVIMGTAATPKDENAPIKFYVEPPNETASYYLYLHFAELRTLQENESRAFDINLNENLLYGPVIPNFMSTTTIFSTKPITGALNYSFTITKLKNSTLPPIANAAELYMFLGLAQSETHQDDVDAITSIKLTYGVKRNWDGDPCVPIKYRWTGLTCSSDVLDPPRITSLDLSSSGLTGNITYDISKLDMLQSLDLSNNELDGSVPEFLASLQNLKIINLEGNKLTGSVPSALLAKSSNGSLSLRLGENNLNSCGSSPCRQTKKKKRSNVVAPVVASIGGLIAVLLIASAVLFGLKKKKSRGGGNLILNDSLEAKRRAFTNSEVKTMTSNFNKVLGKGGFGTVYYGFIADDNTPVAVKMLSASSVQGYQEFQAEVKLLMRVHHRNLTSLVGYCNEGTNMALIYEYMANGNLDSHLSSNSGVNVLSWEGRLQIAIDAASGLEYMHNGCRPPIVHRDIKTTNILLTENFQAKIADFGLSRMFPTDGGTHVSTIVAGTPGYLDPEYYVTNRLTEKSDVYSFGVVLLVMISGKNAIITTDNNRIHLGQWVSRSISNGDLRDVVDPMLNDDFDTNSVWKTVEISMACLSSNSNKRPNMTHVVAELSESLSMERARRNHTGMVNSTHSDQVHYMNTTSEFSPSVVESFK